MNLNQKHKNTPIEFFDGWAKEGKDSGMEKGHFDSVSFMINKIKKEKKGGRKGIDIGCGNGWAVREMEKILEYEKIIGIDGSKTMIKKAKEIDPKGEYRCENIKEHEFKQQYDFVHSMEVLYYLKKPQKFIKSVYDKWLTKKGIFILGIDHYKENRESINWPEECGVYMNTKTKKEWIEILKKTGFVNVKSWQVCKKENWEGTLVIMGNKK
tara:strand:- start:2691 stop:3323 length:633 start_codon:yes stop_codon:yes gene_type:complete